MNNWGLFSELLPILLFVLLWIRFWENRLILDFEKID
jgi:hypothetical protein